MDSLFSGGAGSKSKTQTANVFDPTLQALNALRLGLVTQAVAGGLPAAMGGYINKYVVPNTVNTMTASGLGRSGAMGEAVAEATMKYGTDFITALMSGTPSQSPQQVSSTAQTVPGVLDWLSALGPIAGLFGKGGPFGGE